MHHELLDFETRKANLRDRVRDLYEAFHAYPLGPDIEHPRMPGPPVDCRPLTATPLKQLSAAALQTCHRKAMTTWGTVDDFKHFLPRLLDIVATAAMSKAPCELDAWLVFEKLDYGHWQRWKVPERTALNAYFDALWGALLAQPVDVGAESWRTPTLGEWLKAFAYAHGDLSPFLQRWAADASHPTDGVMAAAHLANAALEAVERLLKKRSLNWDMYHRVAAQEAQATAWLGSDAVSELLEQAYLRWPDSPYGTLLSEGHYWLGQWRQTRHA
ncbi:MAG: hypothetical protein QM770_15785 [Tepidisphaeraceae bacterium]